LYWVVIRTSVSLPRLKYDECEPTKNGIHYRFMIILMLEVGII
jgi:hypothetical protein